MTPRVAVIGGGWAGCAAGLSLAEAGVNVTLFEAGNTLGGRARGLEINGLKLDNGQHILLGAYAQTMKLITAVNAHHDTKAANILRSSLAINQPPEFSFACPRLPAPLHLLVGLFTARGLSASDKLAAARWVRHLLNNQSRINDTSVAQLIASQPEKVRIALWQPLCIAALNTPAEHASAQVFVHVLVAAFGEARHHSDLLFPRCDLTALFPQPAAERITALNGQVHLRTRVKSIESDAHKVKLTTHQGTAHYDRVILAVAPQHLAKICVELSELTDIIKKLAAYQYEAIATAYLQYSDRVSLPTPMLALSEGPAQFVFDRGRTHAQAGLLAYVASAASNLTEIQQSEWTEKVHQQLSRVYSIPPPLWQKAIVEKQATYSCRPHMYRPENHTPHPAIFLAGDYTNGAYPATLESATTSGVKSAQLLINSL